MVRHSEFRIYIDAAYFKEGITGLSRFSDELIETMVSEYSNSRIFLICFMDQEESNFIGYNVVRINCSRSFFTYLTIAFPKIAVRILSRKLIGCGIIHFHDCIRFVGDIDGFVSITTIHDIASLVVPAYYSTRSNFLKRKALARLIGSSSKVIAVSKTTKDDLERYDSRFCGRVNIIGEGISAFVLGEQSTAYSFAQDNSKKYFLVVGSAHKRKNYYNTYMAYLEFIRETKCEYKLVFVGRHVKKYFSKCGISIHNQVKIFENISDQQLMDLYDHAYALLNFSFHEGFGLTVLEAMARRCFVIGSNTSSVFENIGEDGITASPYIISDMSSAIKECYFMSSESKNSITTRAYNKVRVKSWSAISNMYIDLYEQHVG